MSPDIGDAAEDFFGALARAPRRARVIYVAVVLALIAAAVFFGRPVRTVWCFTNTVGGCQSFYDRCAAGLRLEECTSANWRPTRANWAGVVLYPNQEIPDEPREKIFVVPRRKITK